MEKTHMRIVLTTLTLAGLSAAVAFAADAKAGQAAYDKSCKACHGTDGTPNPGIVKMMKVDMKDFKSADFQAISDDDIKKIISNGKGKMKPVSAVSGADQDNVVAYIRTLKK
jgi:mono/diheme cytochrome c family protein